MSHLGKVMVRNGTGVRIPHNPPNGELTNLGLGLSRKQIDRTEYG